MITYNPTSVSPTFKTDKLPLYSKNQRTVILPVWVNVTAIPVWEQISSIKFYCGGQTGEIRLTTKTNSQKLNIFLNDSLIGNTSNDTSLINGLGAGNYIFFLKDTLECKSRDTLIIIRDTIRAHADFSFEPKSGNVPFKFHLKDQRKNMENIHYQLIINNQTKQYEENIITKGGNYILQQIAWKNNTSCSDTTQIEFIIYDSLRVRLSEICQSDADSTGFTLFIHIPEHIFGNIQVLDESGVEFYTVAGNFEKGDRELNIFSSACKKITVSDYQVTGQFILTKPVDYLLNSTQTVSQKTTFKYN